ncbi:deoxyribodipyrimidine photo-lyase [Vibrio agarivorans]|uniref:deoxyribodipyrimidine photo-lyase n=1 Tax=Vibrio agarivorans TaxID=153622 RepID=UPI0025B44FD9|nr:deoxyribodipyrimidine photo-lyase [Vibrio agarivorans]MDN3660895.1 deoxyribodipyrimidine photo-lyase [Vibrio agarivorans]
MELVWFRRDLRVDDNPALQAAIRSNQPVVALFIATPQQWQQHNMAPRQADLIFRRLSELQRDLSQLNITLLYKEVDIFDDAIDEVVGLCQQYAVTTLHANHEYELNEVNRDEQLQQRLGDQKTELQLYHDRCLTVPGSVLNKQGNYFKVFTPFKKALLAQWQPRRIVKVEACLANSDIEITESQWQSTSSPFGYPREDSQAWPVGTQAIRQRLRDFCQDTVEHYQQERDFPAKPSTSQLSAYLAIGALSPRQCVARLYANGDYLNEGGSTWLSELIWRDFYQHLIFFEPKLCQHKDFVEWAPHIRWDYSDDRLIQWQEGRTGYPIVDAAMRQLNQTGWMHNRLRMVVASFFTKDLHLDWRLGERYFMSKLIDGDFAANNGGWQWCASTGCDGQPYFRIFNPISQGERFDAQGEFVRHWIPELKAVPNKFVHAPWLWSEFDSIDYPPPIVDHKVEREITLALYKEAKDF